MTVAKPTGRGRGRSKAEDGLPVPECRLSPNQQAVRRAIVLAFDGRVTDLAKALRSSPQAVYNWISGRQEPAGEFMAALADIVDLEALWQPELDTIYFQGVAIRPGDPGYDELVRHARATLAETNPDLAKKLGL